VQTRAWTAPDATAFVLPCVHFLAIELILNDPDFRQRGLLRAPRAVIPLLIQQFL
jgi:hypothetical protein